LHNFIWRFAQTCPGWAIPVRHFVIFGDENNAQTLDIARESRYDNINNPKRKLWRGFIHIVYARDTVRQIPTAFGALCPRPPHFILDGGLPSARVLFPAMTSDKVFGK
jgi:hypothetical protein